SSSVVARAIAGFAPAPSAAPEFCLAWASPRNRGAPHGNSMPGRGVSLVPDRSSGPILAPPCRRTFNLRSLDPTVALAQIVAQEVNARGHLCWRNARIGRSLAVQ